MYNNTVVHKNRKLHNQW